MKIRDHESTPLVVGLIGSGGIARMHAPAWKALGAHVLVHSGSRAEAVAAEFDLEVVLSLDEVLTRASIIDIVTPTFTHESFALAAIAAGKSIVCEKPLTLTAASSRTVIDAATAAGVQIFPAHVVRYTAPYASAHRSVAEGRLGRILEARFHREGSSPAIGTWFQEVKLSGGVIMDLMLHDLDQARWICGDVLSVHAVQDPPTANGLIPPFVTANVTLTHVGGVTSHLTAVWGPPGTTFNTGFSIAGDRGTLTYSSLENPAQGNPYLDELCDFTAAFRGEATPRVTTEDALIAVELAEAAQRSVDSGQLVVLNR